MVSRSSHMVGKAPFPFVNRVLILGGRGRLGAALVRRWTPHHTVHALSRPELDVADLPALRGLLKAAEYDILVNATGLTNADRCETARREATVVNAEAPALMAQMAAARSARLIHFSTDYVFDGENRSPYTETDTPNPLGHYGQTKLAGEIAVRETSDNHLVVRVSWIFGAEKPSFVDALLERASIQDRVEAIADKTSCPTFADDIADWMSPFLSGDLPGGLYHACNAGSCSWQVYGQFALDYARKAGVPLRTRTVRPISLADMAAFVAKRPPHTAMATDKLRTATSLVPRPWQEALEEYLHVKFRSI